MTNFTLKMTNFTLEGGGEGGGGGGGLKPIHPGGMKPQNATAGARVGGRAAPAADDPDSAC